jgi:ribosome-binding protein aMBF1 (putative translation factor)
METKKTHFSTIFDIEKEKVKMLEKNTIEKPQELSEQVLKRIVERRQELGVSQTDLAIKLNMTTSGYFKVEKGESKLDLIRLFEIAEFLNIDAKDLF